MGLVAHEVIDQIYQTAIDAQMTTEGWRKALLGGIDEQAAGMIGRVNEPNLQLESDLRWANSHELADGTYPLVRWLANAARLNSGVAAGPKFAEFLRAARDRTRTVPGRRGPLVTEVDRHPQWREYRKSAGPVRLFLLPCEAKDVPGKFVEGVHAKLRDRLASDGKTAVQEVVTISWPEWHSEEVIKDRFREVLEERLGVAVGASAASIKAALEKHSFLVVELRIKVREFGELLAPFLKWLAEFWKDHESSAQVQVFGHLIEPGAANEIDQIMGQVGSIGVCSVKPLPPLAEVRESDIEAWIVQFGGVLDPENEAKLLMDDARQRGGTRMIHVIPALESWQRKPRAA